MVLCLRGRGEDLLDRSISPKERNVRSREYNYYSFAIRDTRSISKRETERENVCPMSVLRYLGGLTVSRPRQPLFNFDKNVFTKRNRSPCRETTSLITSGAKSRSVRGTPEAPPVPEIIHFIEFNCSPRKKNNSNYTVYGVNPHCFYSNALLKVNYVDLSCKTALFVCFRIHLRPHRMVTWELSDLKTLVDPPSTRIRPGIEGDPERSHPGGPPPPPPSPRGVNHHQFRLCNCKI